MTGPRRIVFASPIEPSGASWLVNCFLELGIRVKHRPAETKLWREGDPSASIWIDEGGLSRLAPRAGILGKWMPSLVHRTHFRFRDDLVVDYRQDLPRRQESRGDTLLFVRDPRDALYSMYRRRQPAMTFAEFCDFPNAATLLNRPDHWRLHVESWLARTGGQAYRFEDYKSDAPALLRRILAGTGIDATEAEIGRAVAASDSRRAKEAEAIYRQRNPGDQEIANRAGLVGDWKTGADTSGAIGTIERWAGAAMRRLGYLPEEGAPEQTSPGPAQRACLRLFETLDLPDADGDPAPDPLRDPDLPGLVAQIARLTPEALAAARLSPAEARMLLKTMAEFQAALSSRMGAHLDHLARHVQDGEAAHLGTLNTLLRERRAARRAGRGQA